METKHASFPRGQDPILTTFFHLVFFLGWWDGWTPLQVSHRREVQGWKWTCCGQKGKSPNSIKVTVMILVFSFDQTSKTGRYLLELLDSFHCDTSLPRKLHPTRLVLTYLSEHKKIQVTICMFTWLNYGFIHSYTCEQRGVSKANVCPSVLFVSRVPFATYVINLTSRLLVPTSGHS